MRLPWYVALDRWVRRHRNAWIHLWLGALGIPVLIAAHSQIQAMPLWALLPVGFLIGMLIAVTRDIATSALEHYADKWREEH